MLDFTAEARIRSYLEHFMKRKVLTAIKAMVRLQCFVGFRRNCQLFAKLVDLTILIPFLILEKFDSASFIPKSLILQFQGVRIKSNSKNLTLMFEQVTDLQIHLMVILQWHFKILSLIGLQNSQKVADSNRKETDLVVAMAIHQIDFGVVDRGIPRLKNLKMHSVSARTLIYSMVVTLPLQQFAQINWVGSVAAAAVPQKVIQDFLQNYFVAIVELEEISQFQLVEDC